MAAIEIYKPIVPGIGEEKSFEFALRPCNLIGKRIGLIDTSKVNADLFLKRIEELLINYGIAGVFKLRKKTPGATLTQEELLEFRKNVDAALIAFGD